MTTAGDLKKMLERVPDDTPLCIGDSINHVKDEPTHVFENGNQFVIYQTEVGFVEDNIGYMDDGGELQKGKVLILI